MGNISTTGSGNGASGIFAYTNTGNATVNSTGRITTTGDIFTTGVNANGIQAHAYFAGPAAVTSTGNITTKGDNSFGINANGFSGSPITSIGSISTSGVQAYGIFANRTNGCRTVNPNGAIATSGDGSHAINATSNAAGVAVSTSGNISASGVGANAIYANVNTGDASVTVKSGTISSTQSDAIVADGGGVKVDNSGTVSGTVKLVGSTSAAFNILKGGVYESGATAVLAANDTLTNAPFAVTSKIDRTVTDLGTAVEIIGGNDTALGLQYDGQFAETTTQHTWSGKLGVKF